MSQNQYAKKCEAEARRKERNTRNPFEQMAALDFRLGKGVGASRERARLQAQIDQIEAANREREKAKKATYEALEKEDKKLSEAQAKNPNKVARKQKKGK